MRCPTCGAKTGVDRSRLLDSGSQVSRQRACKGPVKHIFETVEQRADYTLRRVLVRHSGDGALAEKPFDRERLLRDVRLAVLKRMDDRSSQAVVSDVVRSLEAALPDLVEILTDDEKLARPGFDVAISDTRISHAIDRRLRDTNRLSQVLYALSIFGREDREGRNGWQDARQVLEWLYRADNYPDLRAAIPPTRLTQVENWFARNQAPSPRYVIKRQTRRLTPFDHVRFVQSINKAMLGRRDAAVNSHHISEWVLWSLAGHDEVLTSQLGIAVMECLRRVDDVSYLRWATIAKNFDTVTRFRDEALTLVTRPSPRLTFNGDQPIFRAPKFGQ